MGSALCGEKNMPRRCAADQIHRRLGATSNETGRMNKGLVAKIVFFDLLCLRCSTGTTRCIIKPLTTRPREHRETDFSPQIAFKFLHLLLSWFPFCTVTYIFFLTDFKWFFLCVLTLRSSVNIWCKIYMHTCKYVIHSIAIWEGYYCIVCLYHCDSALVCFRTEVIH